jgi:hypothetical protein
MSQDYLGEFEQMVLLCIMRLGSEAYGLAIKDEMEAVAGRSPSTPRWTGWRGRASSSPVPEIRVRSGVGVRGAIWISHRRDGRCSPVRGAR